MRTNRHLGVGLSVLTLIGVRSAAFAAASAVDLQKAEALLARAESALAGSTSLQARYTDTASYSTPYRDLRQTGTVNLARPGFIRVEITRARRVGVQDRWKVTGNNTLRVSDGTTQTNAFFHSYSVQAKQAPAPLNPGLNEAPALEAFWAKPTVFRGQLARATELKVDGNKLEYRLGDLQRRLWFREDGILQKVSDTNLATQDQHEWNLDSLTLNAKAEPEKFHYAIPADALPYDRNAGDFPLERGNRAPEFDLVDSRGAYVKLSQLRGKVVVLKFWATWCWPCNQSLPETEALAAKQGEDVVTVAVAIHDSKRGLEAWLAKHRQFSHIRFLFEDPNHATVSRAYDVRVTPTTYIIDRNGAVSGIFEGFPGPNPKLAEAIETARTR